MVKADQSEGSWRSVSKAQKGKAGRGWGLKDGMLAGNPSEVFERLQQNQEPSYGGKVAKFQQAAIGGRGSFEHGRDFNLLSAFEQFVEGSQGRDKYGGKTGRSKTGREEEKPEQKNINLPDIEKKRKEGGEGRVEESLSKLVSRRETNGRIDGKREETNAGGGQKQSLEEKLEGSSEEKMLMQVVDNLKKGISKESNDLKNRTTVNSSPPLLAQNGVTPLMGENPIPFVGKSSISEEGNTVSVNRPAGKEMGTGGGKEIKDKNGAATEFPRTEMDSEEDVGEKEGTTKRQTENIGNDLNGVPATKHPRRKGKGTRFILFIKLFTIECAILFPPSLCPPTKKWISSQKA